MSETRTAFLLDYSIVAMIDAFPAEQQLALYKAVMKYAYFKEEPTSLTDHAQTVFWQGAKATLDASWRYSDEHKRKKGSKQRKEANDE